MSKADEREEQRARQIKQYAARVVREASPMTDDERRQIVELLRPSARRLRELTRTHDDVA